MGRKILSFVLAFAAAVALSFSSAPAALAATSYSTPVTLTGDPDTSSFSNVSMQFLSLANSMNPDDVDQLTTYNGNTYDYLYRATADFPFTLTVPYADYSSFIFYNTFQVDADFGTNNRVIGYEFEVVNSDPNLHFQYRTVNNGSRVYVSIRANDYDFTKSKLVSWILRVRIYFDRTSGVYETVPQSVGSATLSSRTSYISGGAYSHGDEYSTSLYKTIADAIDLSPNLTGALEFLDSIADDTSLLSQVLTNTTTLNSKFQTFYDLVNAYWDAYNATGSQNPSTLNYFDSIRVYMQRLQAAFTGSSTTSSQTPSQLAELTFNRWVNIVTTALNNQAPDMTQASAEKDNVQNLSDTQHQQEAVIFTQAASAIDDIDFNLNIPSGVISAAVTLMSLTGMIWERLGDFQFIAIATLTAGAIVTLLGAINRFPKSDDAILDREDRLRNKRWWREHLK